MIKTAPPKNAQKNTIKPPSGGANPCIAGGYPNNPPWPPGWVGGKCELPPSPTLTEFLVTRNFTKSSIYFYEFFSIFPNSPIISLKFT